MSLLIALYSVCPLATGCRLFCLVHSLCLCVSSFIGLFHLISIHPPRKSVNYVGGVNNGQKLMCPRGAQLKSQIVSRGV